MKISELKVGQVLARPNPDYPDYHPWKIVGMKKLGDTTQLTIKPLCAHQLGYETITINYPSHAELPCWQDLPKNLRCMEGL